MIEIPKIPLTAQDVLKVARKEEQVRLSVQARHQLQEARAIIDTIPYSGAAVYGVNTGFGALANVTLSPDRLTRLQYKLIDSHAVGWGAKLEPEIVRSAMFLRANMLAKGYSGVRPAVVEMLIKMLNYDIVPVVPETGSVGASGDLAPLAFIVQAMLGRGEVYFKNNRMSAARALKKAGLKPLGLEIKEGLSLINGTEMMAGAGAVIVEKSKYLVKLLDLASAFSVVALQGQTQPFRLELMKLKPHLGQMVSAKNLRKLLQGYTLSQNRVQDAYSLRCIPQINGAIREGINFAQRIVNTELNSVTDNPVLITHNNKTELISGGNFHGQAIALALDTLAISLTSLGVSTERRIFRMLDDKLSGLSAFLIQEAGENSGLMMLQVLATALISENKVLSNPASIHSLPTSASQEDLVSMGMTAANKLKKILENSYVILSIELLCARQAIELGGFKVPDGLKIFYEIFQKEIPFITEDRPFQSDLEKVLSIINSKKFVGLVENEIF
ncbi:MAG: histidine ammonia-lyase [candidate division WOR-3 bacterium]